MARLHRSCPPGYTQHVIQRGNNRAPCFGDDADRYQYIEWLTEYAQEFAVAVHAWVLMTNHVHLLATPSTEGGLSRLMQFLRKFHLTPISPRPEQDAGTMPASTNPRSAARFWGRYQS